MILTIIKAEILRYFLFYMKQSHTFAYKELSETSSDADRSNMNGCQIITTKRGNSSNSLDFKEVYSLYRFTIKSGIRKNVVIELIYRGFI